MTAPTAEARSIAAAATFLAVAALASRVLGFVRDAVIAAMLGASEQTDAYYAAFFVPDLLLYLLSGGALSLAFQPMFAAMIARGEEPRAWRLFGRIGLITAVGVGLGTVAAFVSAPWIVAHAFAFAPEQDALVVSLTRIMLVGPVAFAIGGLVAATEQQRKRFWPAAVGALVYNVCIVVGGVALAPRMGVHGFAIGVAAGAVLGPLALPLWSARRRIRLAIGPPLLDADVRRYFALALPLMLGVSLAFGDEWIGRVFASAHSEGAVTHLNNARRLLLLPVALVGQAAALASIPWLSELIARREQSTLQRTVEASVETTATLATVAAAGLAATAGASVRLVYGRGAYDDADVAATAALLALLAPAALGWTLQTVLTRVCYAAERTLGAMLVGTATLVAAIPVYAALDARWGVPGLAAAASIAFVGSLPAYVWLARSAAGVATGAALARGVVAGLPGAAFGAAGAWLVGAGAGHGTLGALGVCAAFVMAAVPALLVVPGPAAVAVRSRLVAAARRLRRTRAG